MPARWGPEYELKIIIVAALRESTNLHALLFPSDVPQVNPLDTRVYESDAYLPAELRGVLPRLLVEVDSDTTNWEQEDPAGDLGPITVRLHHFVAQDDRERLEDMALQTSLIMDLIGETPPAPDRIIASELVKTGVRVKNREPAFNDAYRLTETYLSRLVGVIG